MYYSPGYDQYVNLLILILSNAIYLSKLSNIQFLIETCPERYESLEIEWTH